MSPVKKIFRRIFLVLTVLSLLWLLILLGLRFLGPLSLSLSLSEPAAVGVIGGADGPTAVYVTASPVSFLFSWQTPLLLGILFLSGYLLLSFKK